jgi:hypothetical protein
MAQDVCVLVNADDRARLAAIAGASRSAVWRRQRRFAEEGVDGLLHDKPRVPGKAPLPRGKRWSGFLPWPVPNRRERPPTGPGG